jgi:hypothetical protein
MGAPVLLCTMDYYKVKACQPQVSPQNGLKLAPTNLYTKIGPIHETLILFQTTSPLQDQCTPYWPPK